MKKMALPVVLFVFVALLCLSACVDIALQPKLIHRGVPRLYAIEFLSAREYYDLGDAVNLRLTLTNVSTQTVTFGTSNDIPVLDLQVDGGDITTHKLWSKENPDEVRYNVALRPSESYMLTWTLTLSSKGHYGVAASWIDPREGERFSIGSGFLYGERLPMP